MLLDLICLNLGFIVAYMIRINAGNPYTINLYRHMLIVMCIVDIGVVLSMSSLDKVMQRGYYKEFMSLTKQSITNKNFPELKWGGKPGLLYEWHAVIKEEDIQMNLERMTGMTERFDLVGSNKIALSLCFKERRKYCQEKEGTDNV